MNVFFQAADELDREIEHAGRSPDEIFIIEVERLLREVPPEEKWSTIDHFGIVRLHQVKYIREMIVDMKRKATAIR